MSQVGVQCQHVAGGRLGWSERPLLTESYLPGPVESMSGVGRHLPEASRAAAGWLMLVCGRLYRCHLEASPTSLAGEAAAKAFLGPRRHEAMCQTKLYQRRAARGNYPGQRLICGVRLRPNDRGVKPVCDRPSLQRHGRLPVPLRSRGSVVAGQILLPLEHGVRLGLFRHLAGQRLGLLQLGSVFGGLLGHLLGHNRLVVFVCH